MDSLFNTSLSLPANIGLFIAATAVVWWSGTRLAVYGDELAGRLGLTRAFIGLFFLAAATEFPEIVTTLTAAAAGNASMVLGNMFGGVTMQTAILGIVDIFFVHRALTSWPRKPTHALEAVFLILMLNVLLIFTLFRDVQISWNIGLGAVVLFAAYPLIIWMLKRYDKRSSWAPIDLPEDEGLARGFAMNIAVEAWRTQALVRHALLGALLILIAGYVTADRADAIAEQTGLGPSFVGVAFLAAATSMPELSTTIAAARMGAYTMAISNIFGSNLIMVALILPADIAYREGPILAEADLIAQVSIALGIAVTAIYVAGILIRRTPRVMGAGLDSILVLAIYFGSLFALYLAQAA